MGNEVARFRLTAVCLGKPIHVEATALDAGVHVSVYGGDRPHIGAVSVADPDGRIATTQFPGHRDAAVSEAWAGALAARGFLPAVVVAGIHYDGLSREGIRAVLEKADGLLEALLAKLEPRKASRSGK